ncbi:MAG: zinc dependent phospholipase C family protein [Candidatus Hadarchaeales archaeon]
MWRKMKKLMLGLPLIFLLISTPLSAAWVGDTHREVAAAAYRELPENIRNLLNLDAILTGATLPDRERESYGHRYPATDHPYVRQKAVEWVERVRENWLAGDYHSASLAMGILSHFIADATSLPHCINDETITAHSNFEESGRDLKAAPPSFISGFELEKALEECREAAEAKWRQWLKSMDKSTVQEGVNLAATYTYNAWVQALEIDPTLLHGEEHQEWVIAAAGVSIAGLTGIFVKLLKRKKTSPP